LGRFRVLRIEGERKETIITEIKNEIKIYQFICKHLNYHKLRLCTQR